MDNVFYNIFDPEKRQSWDTNFTEISVINDEDCEILYCQLQSPFGVTPRDFLQYRKALLSPSEHLCILMRSADHDARPYKPGFIRAESYISGYIMRQNANDCEVFIMSQTDIKGLIPKWIVNMMASKAPAQWVDNLLKSCQKVLDKQFGGNEDEMKKFLNEYVNSNTLVSSTSPHV